MEENINKKNNIQVNALNVGTEKASSKYYSYQNDYTDIIQANTNNFNGNEEISLRETLPLTVKNGLGDLSETTLNDTRYKLLLDKNSRRCSSSSA